MNHTIEGGGCRDEGPGKRVVYLYTRVDLSRVLLLLLLLILLLLPLPPPCTVPPGGQLHLPQ